MIDPTTGWKTAFIRNELELGYELVKRGIRFGGYNTDQRVSMAAVAEIDRLRSLTVIDLIHAAGYTVEPWDDAVGSHFQVVKDDQRVTSEAFRTRGEAYHYAAGWLIPSEEMP